MEGVTKKALLTKKDLNNLLLFTLVGIRLIKEGVPGVSREATNSVEHFYGKFHILG